MLVPCWLIAFFAPSGMFQESRVTHPHDSVANEIRGIRLRVQNQHEENPDFAFDEYNLADLPSNDSWGNPFQFVELNETGIYGCDSILHVYSMGSDGVSLSDGNDPDDINSWSYHLSLIHI